MLGIVLELQSKALDPSIRVADLLRMSLVVAKKLGLSEFVEWVESELNGYSNKRPPDYREIRGQIKGFNGYSGMWMPLMFEDAEMCDRLSKQRATQPIAELEQLLGGDKPGSMFHLPFPEKLRAELSKGFGFETQVSLITDRSALVGIIDAVRTVVLNWTLKLEEAGIHGEGLTFSEQEKSVAKHTQQNVNNFYAPVHGQQIQQGNETATQAQVISGLDVDAVRTLLPRLKGAISTLPLDDQDRAELEAEVATIETQIQSPKPKQTILKESLRSARTILEGVAGGAGGQLVVELGKLLIG